ncbi:hypothetical protein [Listeria kieliensis]|uniref:Uncharacterized protein n=1 Tax=Listeria kieliensis TaxID=1621700 RepID=A0A3D8TRW0_9LIST|nr:hypothetical protein [Listeria kieliensis]RDX01472.1 hypothetical protein UR08_11255 [Listeria kieliensis]
MMNESDLPRHESILYFETIIKKHDKVRSLDKVDDYLYCLTLYNSKKYRVYLTNLYTVGIADVIELSNLHDINAIVTMSSWNSYTLEAKEYGQSIGIGVFIFKELMGAINYDRPAQYFSGYDKDGNKVYEGARD